MKKDELEKINQLSLSELEGELTKESQAMAKLVLDKNLAKIKNVHQLGQAKKKLAIIKTKIAEKKLAKGEKK